jgi:hypothetical protein
MKPNPSKLQHQQQEQQTSDLRETQQQQAAREFASVEELIRLDAAETVPPASLAERLNESIAREPKPERPWWKRLFS